MNQETLNYRLLADLAGRRLEEFLGDLAADFKEWLDIDEEDRDFAVALYRVSAEQADERDESEVMELFQSARQEYLVSAAERNRDWFEETRAEVRGEDEHPD